MELKTDALAGQVAAALLQQIQTLRAPYPELPEAEQQAAIDGTEKLAVMVVEGVRDLILAQGGGTADITIHNVTIDKDTVGAKVSLPRNNPHATSLMVNAHLPGKMQFLNVGPEIVSLGERAKPKPSQEGMFTDDDNGDPLFHEDGRVNDPDDKPLALGIKGLSPDDVAEIDAAKAGADAEIDAAVQISSEPMPESTEPKKTTRKRKSPTAAKKSAAGATRITKRRRTSNGSPVDLVEPVNTDG